MPLSHDLRELEERGDAHDARVISGQLSRGEISRVRARQLANKALSTSRAQRPDISHPHEYRPDDSPQRRERVGNRGARSRVQPI